MSLNFGGRPVRYSRGVHRASRPASSRARRDRHDRRFRGPMAWPPTPSMKSRRDAFDEAVLDAVTAAEQRSGMSLADIEVGVEDVPPSDAAAWEESICLGRAFPAQGPHKARIVLYRLPIQTRGGTDLERDALIDHVVNAQLAGLLGHPFDADD